MTAQEALDELKRAKETLYPLVTMYDNTGLSDEVATTLNDIIPTFEELVDRATPKKPTEQFADVDNKTYGKCSVCGEYVCRGYTENSTNFKHLPIAIENHYCGYCGNKIDWSISGVNLERSIDE